MVKDIKYIIKRILIGVGIALILSFLRYGFILNTHAKEISSIFNQIPAGNVQGVNNMTQYVNFNFNSGHWSNWGYGILRFNFSIIKVGGSSLAPLVVPSNVSATNFACDVSSTSTSNSTFTGSTYSASCPMIMGPNGLEFISIILTDNQQNEQGIYRITMGSLLTFEKIEDVTLDTSSTTSAINNQITNDNNNTQNIINNQNSNKQEIINNQNQNTQNIINNQNTNTESTNNTIKEQFEVCESGDLSLDFSDGIETGSLSSNGNISTASNRKVSDFILLEKNTTYTIEKVGTGLNNNYLCLFSENKLANNCPVKYTLSGKTYTFNTGNNLYMRTTLQEGTTIILKGMGEICYNRLDKTNENLNNINNTINNDNVDSQQASDFFSNFQTDSHGLSGIITSPLRLIESLSSSQCSPLVLPLPFVNQSATIPCMSSVYSKFPTFYNLWQLISTGIIAYYILIKLFGHVKGMQNPNDDRIEVLNL